MTEGAPLFLKGWIFMEAGVTPKMRTVKQAMEELRKLDPCTALTERALRRMIDDNDISYVAIGRKKLLNFDLLLAKLAGNAYNIGAVRGPDKEDGTWHP